MDKRKEGGAVSKRNIKSSSQKHSVGNDSSVSLKTELQIAREQGLVITNYNNIEKYPQLAVDNLAFMALQQKKPVKLQNGLHYFGKIQSFDSSRGFAEFFMNGNIEEARFIKNDIFIDGTSIDQSLPLYDVFYVGMPVELYVTKYKSSARSEGKIVKYKAEYVGCHPVYFGVIDDVHGTTGTIKFLKGKTHQKAFFKKDIVWIDGKKGNVTIVNEILKKNSPVTLLVDYYDDKTDVKFKAFFVSPITERKNEDSQSHVIEQSQSKIIAIKSKDKPGLTGFVLRYVSFDKGVIRAYIDGVRHELYFTSNFVKVPPKFVGANLQDCIPVNSTVYFDAVVCNDNKEKYEISSLWFGKKSECLPLYQKSPTSTNTNVRSFFPLVEGNTSSKKLSQNIPEKNIATVSPCVRNEAKTEYVSHMTSYEKETCQEKVKQISPKTILKQLGIVQSFLADDLGVLSYNYCGINNCMPFHKNVVSLPENNKNIKLRDYLQVGQEIYFNGQFLYPNDVSTLVFTKVWPAEEFLPNFLNNGNCVKELQSKTSYSQSTSVEDTNFPNLFKMSNPAVSQNSNVKPSVVKVSNRGDEVFQFNEPVLQGIIKYVLEDFGVLTGCKSQELGFTRETMFLYGIPLQNYNLQVLFRQGDVVEYIFDPCVGVKKAWFGCSVVTNTEASFTELLTFCEGRKIKPFLINLLIQDYDKFYLSKRDGNINDYTYNEQEKYIGACSSEFASDIECIKHDDKTFIYEENARKPILFPPDHERFSISDDSSDYRSITGDSSVYESATDSFEENHSTIKNLDTELIPTVAISNENDLISFDSDEYTPNITEHFTEETSLGERNKKYNLSVPPQDCLFVSENLSDCESVSTIENISVCDLDVEDTSALDNSKKDNVRNDSCNKISEEVNVVEEYIGKCLSKFDLFYTSDSATSSKHESVAENIKENIPVTESVSGRTTSMDMFEHVSSDNAFEDYVPDCNTEHMTSIDRFKHVSSDSASENCVPDCNTEHKTSINRFEHVSSDSASENYVPGCNACVESAIADISIQHSSVPEILSLEHLYSQETSEKKNPHEIHLLETSDKSFSGNTVSKESKSSLQLFDFDFEGTSIPQKDENGLGIYLSDSDDDCYQYNENDLSLQTQNKCDNKQDELHKFIGNFQSDDDSIESVENFQSDDYFTEVNCLQNGSESIECITVCKEKESPSVINVLEPEVSDHSGDAYITTDKVICEIFDPDFIIVLKSLLEKKLPGEATRTDSVNIFTDSIINHMNRKFGNLICEMLRDALFSELENTSSVTDENSNGYVVEELHIKQMLINELVEDFKKTVLESESASVNKPPKQVASIETQTVSTGSVIYTRLLTDKP